MGEARPGSERAVGYAACRRRRSPDRARVGHAGRNVRDAAVVAGRDDDRLRGPRVPAAGRGSELPPGRVPRWRGGWPGPTPDRAAARLISGPQLVTRRSVDRLSRAPGRRGAAVRTG